MVQASILGIVSGILGFIPLVIAFLMTKRNPSSKNFAPMAKLILGLISSFVLLFLLAILFVAFDRDDSLFFVLAEAIALCASAIAYGIWSQKRDRK